VHILVDDVLEYTSAFLGPGNSTGVIALNAVTAGSHVITVVGEGTPGGCNGGTLFSWGGDLTVTTSPSNAPVYAGTPGRPNCHGKSVSALAQTYGDLATAASALGFASVAALQNDIRIYCQ